MKIALMAAVIIAAFSQPVLADESGFLKSIGGAWSGKGIVITENRLLPCQCNMRFHEPSQRRGIVHVRTVPGSACRAPGSLCRYQGKRSDLQWHLYRPVRTSFAAFRDQARQHNQLCRPLEPGNQRRSQRPDDDRKDWHQGLAPAHHRQGSEDRPECCHQRYPAVQIASIGSRLTSMGRYPQSLYAFQLSLPHLHA